MSYHSYDDYLGAIADTRRPKPGMEYCPNADCDAGELVSNDTTTETRCPVCGGEGLVAVRDDGELIVPNNVVFVWRT